MSYTRRIVDLELDDLFGEVAALALDGPKGVGKTTTAEQRAAGLVKLDVMTAVPSGPDRHCCPSACSAQRSAGSAVERAPKPGPPHPAASLFSDQRTRREVVLVEPTFPVGVKGAIRHHAKIQCRRSQAPDIGETVHHVAQSLHLACTRGGIVTETRGQDQPLPPRYRTFEPGMVYTCEPGIYIREENLGIRLENDILITATGNQDLMAAIPLEVADIERLMRAG